MNAVEGPMLWPWVVVFALGWTVVAVLVGRRAYVWHRRRGRPFLVAGAVAVLGGLLWPLTLWLWNLDWALTGRERRNR
jgi:hypothetical protein